MPKLRQGMMPSEARRHGPVAAAAAAALLFFATGCGTLSSIFHKTPPIEKRLNESGLSIQSLQTEVLRFADDYVESVGHAADGVSKAVGTRQAEVAGLKWKIDQATAAYADATGENAIWNVLDLTVLATVSTMVVEDARARLDVPTQRGYQSGAALPFHVDRTDVVGLLCVRAADSGGESRVVSAAAVERMLGETVPEALAELQAPLPQDRHGEEQPGERPWAATPVFCDGGVTRYGRRFIETSQRFPDAPRLRPEQWDALDAVDAVLATPG